MMQRSRYELPKQQKHHQDMDSDTLLLLASTPLFLHTHMITGFKIKQKYIQNQTIETYVDYDFTDDNTFTDSILRLYEWDWSPRVCLVCRIKKTKTFDKK